MTDIEQKALALVNEVREERGYSDQQTYPADRKFPPFEALCRAIEQHEAFRQEVSDEIAKLGCWPDTINLQRFIIAKPDPLVEVLQEISGEGGYDNFDHYAYRLRSALEARDLEIREKQL